jgi:hypothetical protein
MSVPVDPQYVYTPVDVLLPQELFNLLSPESRRAYEKVWNLMSKKGRDNVWLSDHALSVSARVPYRNIKQAKAELEQAGLLKIRCGQWPADDPQNVCNEYRFVAQD